MCKISRFLQLSAAPVIMTVYIPQITLDPAQIMATQLCEKIKKEDRLQRKAKEAKPSNKQQRWDAHHNNNKPASTISSKPTRTTWTPCLRKMPSIQAKSFFKTSNAKRKDIVGAPPLRLKKNGKLENSARRKAKVLSAQNSSVFKEEDTLTIPTFGTSPYPGMTRIMVTCAEIAKLLRSLTHKKVIGPDQVLTYLRMGYAQEITPILQSDVSRR